MEEKMSPKELRDYMAANVVSTRQMCKEFLQDEGLDRSLAPAIQGIISACLQFEFICYCMDLDSSLENGAISNPA